MISLEIKKLLHGDDQLDSNLINSSTEFKLAEKCYFKDFSFNWMEIGKILNLDLRNGINLEYSYKNCLSFVEHLRPLYASTFNVLDNIVVDHAILRKSLLWLDNDIIINHLLSKTKTETYYLESILLYTSALEFALGNIYFTLTNKTPPHLLRDLLRTEELETFFGKIPIIFLLILLGTPNSINIRNIVWHGFPTINDLPAYYHSTLILIVISLAKIMQDKDNFKIKSRKKNLNIPYYFEVIDFHSSINNDFHFNSLTETFDEQTLISNDYRTIWVNIFRYYSDSNYSYCIVLLLPQIELLLRILYRDINNFDVSAKLDEYYIIIDTIFELNIPNSSEQNNIFNKLSNNTIKLLYDIFISHNGPRVRDKISHGEINLNTINKETCTLLISLSFNLCSIKKYQFNGYESKFHTNSILVQEMKKCVEILRQLYAIKIPKILEYNFSTKCGVILQEHINIKIFNRPAKEGEVNGLLVRILKNINSACENLLESFNIKFDQLENFTLRSRNKKTLSKMLENLFQEFLGTVEKMLKFVESLFNKLQEDNADLLLFTCEDAYVKTIKFLKKILKYTENLEKYCLITSSEWEKSLQICLNFNSQLDHYNNDGRKYYRRKDQSIVQILKI